MAVPQELATLWHTSTCTSFSARLVLRVRVFRRSCSTDMQDTRIRVRAYRRVAHFVSFLRVSGTLPSRSLARRVFESSSSDHVQCDPGDPCDRHVVLYRREWSSFVDGSTKRFRECRSRGPLASLRIDRPCGTIGSHGAGTGVPTNGWPGMTRARLVDWTGFVTHRTRGRMVGMKCRVVGWTCQRIVASFVSTPVLRTTGWVRGWRTIEPWHGRSSVSPRVLPAFGATPSCPSSFPRIHPSVPSAQACVSRRWTTIPSPTVGTTHFRVLSIRSHRMVHLLTLHVRYPFHAQVDRALRGVLVYPLGWVLRRHPLLGSR